MMIRASIAALLLALPAIAPAQAPAPASQPIPIGTRHYLPSAILGDVREVNVWLPDNYAASADRYPVVYVLDGAVDQDFRHIAALGSLASLSWTFGPFIVVGIQTRDRQAELTPPASDPRYVAAFPKGGGAARFRRFLTQEVIPFVEARYRTGVKRAVMGESLAGLFVIDTLLTEPSAFNDYVAISPSLWWDDRRSLGPTAAAALARARNNAPVPRGRERRRHDAGRGRPSARDDRSAAGGTGDAALCRLPRHCDPCDRVSHGSRSGVALALPRPAL